MREVLADLAPTGKIRAALNLGNKVLVQANSASGGYEGITPALAKELASRLNVEVSFITYVTAGDVAASAASGDWDICFLAIDPERAAEIEFTAAYAVLAGIYVVPDGSPIRDMSEIDRPGIRIGVPKGSAYDLFLSRTISQGEFVHTITGADAIGLLKKGDIDVAAGVQGPLEAFVAANSGYRVIPGKFMEINQAMALPVGRTYGLRYLRDFVEDVKASGFVAEALRVSGQTAAAVAPPAPQMRIG